MGVALTELGLVPFDVTRAEVALARELDVMVTAHIGSVTSAQRPPEVELLHSAGLLDHRQVHVHCNACSNRELDLLADAGASVSLTPETELQMGMGFPIFARALERGLTPSLGCDIVSNNRGDLFTQMRLGLQAERARANQAALDDLEMPQELTLGVRDVLRFATLGGAEALGLGSVCGSIEPGKAADLIVLRTDGLHLTPLNDPVATVVLHAGPADVDTVLVGGQVVRRAAADGGRARGARAGRGLARPHRGRARAARRSAATGARGLVRGHDPGDGAEPRGRGGAREHMRSSISRRRSRTARPSCWSRCARRSSTPTTRRAPRWRAALGVTPDLLRDGEGWATEEIRRLGTHNSTSGRPGTTTRTSAASAPRPSTSCRSSGSWRRAS